MFVVTKDTLKLGERLKSLIDKDSFMLNVEDIKGNILQIRNKILDEFNNLEIEELFLDFTGGLKTMSIGAYLAVEKFHIDDTKKYFSYVLYEDGKSVIIFKRGDKIELNENLSIKEIASIYGVNGLSYKTENSEFYSDEFVSWLLDKIKNQEKEFFIDLWDKRDLKNLNWQVSLKNAPIKFLPASAVDRRWQRQ
jgi:hypothetical protein